jgi:DNA-binding MarR family transcriptional regulator
MLAQLEGISQPTATKLVNGLERDGLVQRAADPADGRGRLVRLTPAGRALIRRARARKIAYVELAIAGLRAASVTAVAAALDPSQR